MGRSRGNSIKLLAGATFAVAIVTGFCTRYARQRTFLNSRAVQCGRAASLLLLVAVGMALPVHSQTYELTVQVGELENWSNKDQYGGEEYSKDSRPLEKLAAKGDANAAFEIGYRCFGVVPYHFQKGICSKGPDDATAKEWLHKAAELGYKDGGGEAEICSQFLPYSLVWCLPSCH